MLTENDIVDAVANHLQSTGYRIDKKLTTLDHGIDIEAVQIATGKVLLVEAKGGTSSKGGSRRHGKPFNGNQVKTHVAVAFYQVARLMQRLGNENASVALALPGDSVHRNAVANISRSIDLLGMRVFFVRPDGSVESNPG